MKKQILTFIFLLLSYGIIKGQSFTFEATGITPIKLRTSANDRMIVTSGGLVGIGTNGVRAKLHVFEGSAGALPPFLPTGTVSAFENNGDTYLSVLSTNNSKGGVTFGSPANVEKGWIRYNHNINEMQLGTNSTARFYIKSGGKVGIGTANPDFNLEVNATSDAGLAVTRYGGDSPGLFGRSAGGTEAAPTATQLNHTLSIFGARGHDGIGFTSSRARIETNATQNWTSTANGAKMAFFTTPNGTVSSTQQMVIDHDGDVGINRTTPQAKLDVDGDIILGAKSHEPAFPNSDIFALNRDGKSIIRFIGTNTTSLSGIAGGVEGMMLYIYNYSTVSFTIKNESATALNENRIWTGNSGTDIVFSARGGAVLVYDGVNLKWRVISYNN